MAAQPTDPLLRLPNEIVLEILLHLPTSSLANLQSCSRPWRSFIEAQADYIYSSKVPSTAPYPHEDVQPSEGPDGYRTWMQSVKSKETFRSAYYSDIRNWKDYARRRTTLLNNWKGAGSLDRLPRTREYLMEISNPVWRFRIDWTDRFIITSGEHGGIKVIDLDGASVLWENREVKRHAHIDYANGVLVWDRDPETMEVWKRDAEAERQADAAASRFHRVEFEAFGARRSVCFRRVALLHHGVQLRGFHVRGSTLLAVSHEGKAFVYDLSEDEPMAMSQLTMNIEPEARGHLFQDESVALFSYESKGFRFYSKLTGNYMGMLHPMRLDELLPPEHFFHVRHELPPPRSLTELEPFHISYNPSYNPNAAAPLTINPGRLQPGSIVLRNRTTTDIVRMIDDEWGSGALWHNWMVGLSKAGRVLICSDWQASIRSLEAAKRNTVMFECAQTKVDPERFNIGGWLSVKHGRCIWEIDNHIYLLHLPIEESKEPLAYRMSNARLFAFPAIADVRLPCPISCMSIHEDCIITTYARARWHHTAAYPTFAENGPMFISQKTIRVIDFVPPSNEEDKREPDGYIDADLSLAMHGSS